MSSKVGGSLLTSGEADEDKDITLDDFLKRVKDGLFGVLFVTNKNSDHNLTWHFLEVCIDHLQDLAFPLCFLLAPWQSEITWLQIILRWISPEKMIQNNPVVFNILLSSLGFVLLNALWVGYSFSQNRFRFIWTLKLLRITLGLFASVLFIPFLGFFTQAVIECDGSHDMGSCWNSANLLRSVATVFVITLFIILAFCVKATFFEPDAKAKDIASRPHSRLEILHLAVRTLLTVLTVIFEVYGNDKTDPNKRVTAIWAFTVVCVLTSSGLAFGFIWYIPYYNFRYAIFRAALMLHFFWSCMCLLFTVIRPNSDIGIIFIALTPIAFLLAGFLTEIRRRSIEKTVVATISDPFTLELYIRFKLIDAGLLYRETSMGMVQGDIEAGRGGIMSGINFGAQKQMSGSTEREIKLMDELVEAYVIAAKNMPKSCMLQLFAGAFYLIHLNNRAQCLATYTKAELLHPRIDEAFMIFRRQRLLNEKFSGGDVIDFIAFEQNMQQARKYESKATLAVIHFWAELLKKQPSFRRLQGHGAAIAAAVSSAQTHYLALIKLSPGAPHVYQLYGHFLINVMNDTKQGQDLLDHAEELEEEHNEMMDDGGDTEAGLDMDKANLDLLSEDNAVITISGEYHNLGHIINVNAMAIKVFGYRRQELIQHNINKLLPSPFSEAHDMFLQRYLETGLAKVIDRARQVLGLGKQGYLFPLTLCVKHMVDAKGMQSFLGIIKPQPESESSGFLIMNAKFEILHFTRNIGDLFGTKPFESSYDDSETRLTITHWIPAITSETASQFLSKTGMKLQHVSHGINYDVTIHGDNVQVTGASCYICRIRFKPEKLDSTIREDAMVDDPIPGGCPFMDDQLRRSSIGRAPRISVANADRHIGEEFDSNGSVDLPMNFSAHNSKENLATNPFGTPNMTAPRRQFSVNGSEPGRTSALSNVRRTAVMSDVASLTSMQRTRNASGERPRFAVDERTTDTQSVASRTKNDDDVDRQSQGSHNSRGSTKSYMKQVIAIKNDKSNRRLQGLNYSFLACLFLLAIIAIVECVEFRKLYESANTTLGKILYQNDISKKLVQVSISVRSLDLVRASGWFWSSAKSFASEKVARSRIDTESLDVRSAAGVVAYCAINSVQLLKADGTLSRRVVPLEALSATLASARFLVEARVDDREFISEASFLLLNAPYEVLRVVNACSVEDKAMASRIGGTLPMELLAYSCIGPVVCLALLLFVVQPLYMRIENNREKFLRMFYDIPKEVVKGIYESHLQRVIASENEDDEVEGDLFNKFALEKVFASIGDKDSMNDGLPTRKSLLVTKSNGKHIVHPFTRWFLSARDDHHRVFLKSFVIFFITAAHFFILGGLSLNYLSKIDNVGSEVYWSSQREILIRETSFFVREVFIDLVRNESISRGQPESQLPVSLHTTKVMADVYDILKDLNYLEDSILFGDKALELDGVLSYGYNNPQAVLELQNACVEASPADCSTFENGVMTRGIHAASDWFRKKATNILANITAARTAGNSTNILFSIDEAIAQLRTLDRDYLDPAYDKATTYYLSNIRQVMSWFSNFNLAFSITYIIMLSGIYLLLIRPLLRSLGDDLRRTAALVYMLPPEVFQRVASFRQWAERHMDAGIQGKQTKKG